MTQRLSTTTGPNTARQRLTTAAALVAALATAAAGWQMATAAQQPPVEQAITLPSDRLDWTPLNPDHPDGPSMATLWGEPATGPFGALLRVPAGFESPMHVHTHGERVVQISGTSLHWVVGETRADAQALRPGDYFAMPGGVAHVSASADVVSIEFITMDGPFDFALHDSTGASSAAEHVAD